MSLLSLYFRTRGSTSEDRSDDLDYTSLHRTREAEFSILVSISAGVLRILGKIKEGGLQNKVV